MPRPAPTRCSSILMAPRPGSPTSTLPGLTPIECDAAFWELAGGRPAVLEDRQHLVIQAGLARCRSDWLLVVDADELVFGDRALPDFLDAIPGGGRRGLAPHGGGGLGPGRRPRPAVRQHLLPRQVAERPPVAGPRAADLRRGRPLHALRPDRSRHRQGVRPGRPGLLPHRQSRGRARRRGHHPPRRQHRAVAGRHVPRPLRCDQPRALDRKVAAADRGEDVGGVDVRAAHRADGARRRAPPPRRRRERAPCSRPSTASPGRSMRRSR